MWSTNQEPPTHVGGGENSVSLTASRATVCTSLQDAPEGTMTSSSAPFTRRRPTPLHLQGGVMGPRSGHVHKQDH